jgi:glutamine amidotransferase
MIVLIDYGAGNLTSVKLAFEALNIEPRITDDAETILAADRVVFPGVGAAGAAMDNLRRSGLDTVIREVAGRGVPFLGICLGTQIIFEHSEEDGGVDCLGLIPGNVRMFHPESPYDKVPQMGWNSVSWLRPHPVFQGLDNNSEFYFVHSYYPEPSDPSCIVGQTTYAETTFAAAVTVNNIVATQFHPEKSGKLGLHILRNFLEWTPTADDGENTLC